MHVAFLNPQGNFDPADTGWTQHPDFGGQLVYVKEVALALADQGHTVDLLTRQILDPNWPAFATPLDTYPHHDRVRIVRIPCGPPNFLPKEQLWPHLGTSWVSGILDFYDRSGDFPDCFSAHYADGGLAAAVLQCKTELPYTFTAHSLGAHKLDKLGACPDTLDALDERFLFRRRLLAEQVAINHAACTVTSTHQERMSQYGHHAYRGAIDVNDDAAFSVIPPGVNRAIFHEEPGPLDAHVYARIQTALARDLPARRRGLPLVVCSSRLDRKKNFCGLVQAFARHPSLAKHANLAIVVRGLEHPLAQRHRLQGEERAILDEVAGQISRARLDEVVTSFSLDGQAELAAAYRAVAAGSGVFALVSLYEPFGLAPLEAMSCGLPAVVTRNGGPQESLCDENRGETYGVLVDPIDALDIADGLMQLLGSRDHWHRLQLAGLQRVVSNYSWTSTARGYIRAFERSLHIGPRSSRLPIPAYFTAPAKDNDIPRKKLAQVYFQTDAYIREP